MPRFAAATLAIAGFALPVASLAQDTGAPLNAASPAAGAPSYARPVAPSDEETVRGRVTAFDGKFGLAVRDDRGFIDNVALHQGTIINPTGLELRPGMSVTIHGYGNGSSFAANEIDTPYNVAYGYPYAGYPYGYGSNVDIGVGFGFGGFGGRGHFR